MYPRGVRLRIATLNAWALPWPVGRLVPERMRAIGAALPSLDADVVALQEVWREDAQRGLLAASARHGYAHRWRPPGDADGASGLLLLSRLPLRDVRLERYWLRGLPERVWQGDYHGHKGFVRARLVTPGGEVCLVNTHLHAQYGPAYREDYRGFLAGEVVQLAAALAATTQPVVAAGDFNLREDQPEYRVLRGLTGLRDLAAELDAREDTSRRAKAYNRGRPDPDARIDYVFARDGEGRALRALRVRRIFDEEIEVAGAPGAYSDHDGVLAELELEPRAAPVRAAGGDGASPSGADPGAVETARRLLADGRARAESRREGRRWSAGGAALGAVLGLAGARTAEISRRRWLRWTLGAGALACLPAGLGLLTLSEATSPQELEAYARAERALESLA